MAEMIQFHSELHKSIVLWLQANRNLTQQERIVYVKNLLVSENLDEATQLHYAAAGFLAADTLFALANKLPESILQTAQGTKEFTERVLRKKKSSFAAAARAKKYLDIKNKIIAIWVSGKYLSRDVCAEQECANLNISYSTARKALRNIPKS